MLSHIKENSDVGFTMSNNTDATVASRDDACMMILRLQQSGGEAASLTRPSLTQQSGC